MKGCALMVLAAGWLLAFASGCASMDLQPEDRELIREIARDAAQVILERYEDADSGASGK